MLKIDAKYGGWVDIALQSSLTLAISVLAGVFGGKWIDNLLGTTPVFTIILVLWGAAGGTVWMILKIKRFAESLDEENSKSDGNGK